MIRDYSNYIAIACIKSHKTGPDDRGIVGQILFRTGRADSAGMMDPRETNKMAGTVDADGDRYLIKDYPQLYEVIGDTYCPQTTYRYDPAPWWHRVMGRKTIPVAIPNPDYRPGMFRVPDLRTKVRDSYANNLHRPESVGSGGVEERKPFYRILLRRLLQRTD